MPHLPTLPHTQICIHTHTYHQRGYTQLLDSFAIIGVMVLSFIFLRVRYHWIHLVGVVLAIAGMVVVFLADVYSLRTDGG